jgi:hypothetical protein
MEFIANTVGCRMVGVLSFQFGRGGDHFHYDWLNIPGMPTDAHDFVAHLDNGDANIERIFTEIKKWYTEIVSDWRLAFRRFRKVMGRRRSTTRSSSGAMRLPRARTD